MVVKALGITAGKINSTVVFYYKKLVTVVDSLIDNSIKTIDAILSKVPKLVDDIYNIVITNLTAKNAVLVGLVYALIKNLPQAIVNPWLLVSLLVAIAVVEGSLRIR